jgi:hypothetical protein
MDKLLESVKSIEQEGLVWGGHQFLPIGYGIKKLQVSSRSFFPLGTYLSIVHANPLLYSRSTSSSVRRFPFSFIFYTF